MTVKDVAKAFNSASSLQISHGINFPDSVRLPTGNFDMDYAMGGGIPMGKVSIFWGSYSSGKTTLALKLAANHQKLYPKFKVVLFDLEQSFQPDWARQLQVNTDELVYVFPAYAERVIDMVMAMMEAPDCGLIIVDSMAVLSKQNEMESSADKATVGGSTAVISKMFRKIMTKTGMLAVETKKVPTVLLINQTRINIGQMFGDPNEQPGGNAPKHASSMTVRLWGKDVMDTNIHPTVPAWKEIKGTITKWRVPILARNFETNMAAIHNERLQQGEFDPWPLLKAESKRLGLLSQVKGGWDFHGQKYKTQNQIVAALADHSYSMAAQKSVTDAAIADLNKHAKA